MFLELSHTKLDIYQVTREFVLACYKATSDFPPEEKFGITSQTRRAAVSVLLNLSEGCSRKSSTERKRFYEIARGSLVEVDTALDIAVNLNYTSPEKLTNLGVLIKRVFQMIPKMLR
jgi:four helix bundle protein